MTSTQICMRTTKMSMLTTMKNMLLPQRRKGAAVQTQCQWIRNKFEHGVFVGKVPKGTASWEEKLPLSVVACDREKNLRMELT